MINGITLTNFMQHTSLHVEFTEGMNGIRGQNEKGKSSLLLAIGYFMYGTRALPLSLEETVTWGEDVNSLRVEMSITIDGHVYSGYRSKNGAEITGNGIRASGQTGVTNFFTSMFGADREVALMVMISHQDNLRAALEEGSGSLIETLANTDLIDVLIKSMQEHYACGNTKALDLQIAGIESSMGPKPVADFANFESEIAAVTARLASAIRDAQATSAEVSRLQPAAEKATSDLNTFRTQVQRREELMKDKKETKAAIDAYVPAALVDTSWHADAKAANEAINRHNEAYMAFRRLVVKPAEGRIEDYHTSYKQLTDSLANVTGTITTLIAQKKQFTDSIISGGKCPTCGTELKSQAEIDAHNSKIRDHLNLIEVSLAEGEETARKTKSVIREIEAVQTASQALLTAAVKINHPNLVIDQTQWPVQVTWNGDGILAGKDLSDIPKALQHNEQVRKAQADHEMALARLQAIETELARPVAGVDPVACQEAIDAYQQAVQAAQEATARHRQAELDLKDAQAALQRAEAAHAQALTMWEAQQKNLAELKATVAEMVENNQIIKKLREVRPIVVSEIWGMVLHLVSDTFSQIRGVQSVISRDEEGFRIDGKKVKAYSGSTQDSLALAIRGTLQKVFLPNIGFTIVDEPGRGMDDTRQSNMLSEIARLGITQTLVVTHSPLVDVYANNLVEL